MLIAAHRVSNDNEIVITKGGSWNGRYYLDGATITDSPLASNGRISCYAVDLTKLQPIKET